MGKSRGNEPAAPPAVSRTQGGRRAAQRAPNDLSSTLLKIQDEERRLIARQLHDTVGQNMAALQMNLFLVRDSAAASEPRSRQALMDSLALAQTCVREIRSLSYALYPPLLDELGLLPALRAYAIDYSQRTGVNLSLQFPARLRRFEQSVEIALFRVAQEGLEILHRNSRGPTLLRIRQRVASLIFELIDPGSLEESDAAIARIGMRVHHLGGKLAVEAGPHGVTLRVTLHSVAQRSKAARGS